MRPSQLAISQWGWGSQTVRGGIDPGDISFRPQFVGVVEVWKDLSSGVSSPGAAGPRRWPEGQLSPRAGSMSPSQSATSRWGWGFRIVQSGLDPGDLRFRPRVVGVVHVLKDFFSGDRKLSFPGAAGPRRCPEGQLSPRAGSMSSQPISNQPVMLGFLHPTGQL